VRFDKAISWPKIFRKWRVNMSEAVCSSGKVGPFYSGKQVQRISKASVTRGWGTNSDERS
jgi:hypothetical protein